jgi:hypothetical protein
MALNAEQPFSIGTLDNPRDNDQQFDTRGQAQAVATDQSCHNDRIMAVWDNETGEVLAIAYAGILYTPCWPPA